MVAALEHGRIPWTSILTAAVNHFESLFFANSIASITYGVTSRSFQTWLDLTGNNIKVPTWRPLTERLASKYITA